MKTSLMTHMTIMTMNPGAFLIWHLDNAGNANADGRPGYAFDFPMLAKFLGNPCRMSLEGKVDGKHDGNAGDALKAWYAIAGHGEG